MTRYEVVPPGSEVSIIVSELKRIGDEKEREFWGNSISRVKKIFDEVEEVLSSITPRSKNVKSCLEDIAHNMTRDDLYEIYLDCEAKLKQVVTLADDSPEALIEARMCKTKLFDMINDLMLLK